MQKYEDLRSQVEADGLVTTRMEMLRRLHGAGRLGKLVREAISKALAANGMGHLPAELPIYQEESVRVYRLGSPIADVVGAVLSPSDSGDQVLRQIGQSNQQDVLRKIRELVCE